MNDIKKESDILTFRNHKGEEKNITRGEFRNAAMGQPDIDHRPIQHIADGKLTPKDHMFQLISINGRPTQL